MEPPGCRVVVLNAPPGITFGIDAMSYTVGPKFQGVRGIPPGLHYVHWSVGGGDEQQSNGFGGRHGFFFDAATAEDVICWSWDTDTEDLVPATALKPSSLKSSKGRGAALGEGSAQALVAAAQRGELDSRLGPYPLEKLTLWHALTDCVDAEVLTRCGLALETKVIPGNPAMALLDSDDEPEDEASEEGEKYSSASPMDNGGATTYGAEDGLSKTATTPHTEIDGIWPTFPAAEPPLPKLHRVKAGQRSTQTSSSSSASPSPTSPLAAETSPTAAGAEATVVLSPAMTSAGESLAAMDATGRTVWCRDGSDRVLALLADVSSKLSTGRSSGGGSGGGAFINEASSSSSSSSCASEAASRVVLGEVQLAFVLFALGFSLPALTFWKRRLALLASCGPSALNAVPELFASLCSTTAAALELVPTDFFLASTLTATNFLEPALRSLLLQIGEYLNDSRLEGSSSDLSSRTGAAGVASVGDALMKEPQTTSTEASQASLTVGRNRLLAAAQLRFGLFLTAAVPSDGASFKTRRRRTRMGIADAGFGEGDDDDDEGMSDDSDEELEQGPDNRRAVGGSSMGDAPPSSAAATAARPAGSVPAWSFAGESDQCALPVGALPGFTGFEDEDELPVVVDAQEYLAQLALVESGGRNSSGDGGGASGAAVKEASMSSPMQGASAFLGPDQVNSSTAAAARAAAVAFDRELSSQYPALISAVRPDEDILMAARRLVDDDDAAKHEESASTDAASSLAWLSPTEAEWAARAVKDASKFLEFELAEPDGMFWSATQAHHAANACEAASEDFMSTPSENSGAMAPATSVGNSLLELD